MKTILIIATVSIALMALKQNYNSQGYHLTG